MLARCSTNALGSSRCASLARGVAVAAQLAPVALGTCYWSAWRWKSNGVLESMAAEDIAREMCQPGVVVIEVC